MDFLTSLLRDVTPAVAALIIFLYLARQYLSQQSERDKNADKFNTKLLEMFGEFRTAISDINTAHTADIKLLSEQFVQSHKDLRQSIDKQTSVISDKLQPVKAIERAVTQAAENAQES